MICRKWHGSAFRSRVVIHKSKFSLQGKENVAYYDSSAAMTKSFCKKCGSSLVSYYNKQPDLLGLPLGAIEGEIPDTEAIHVFTQYKASWYTIPAAE